MLLLLAIIAIAAVVTLVLIGAFLISIPLVALLIAGVVIMRWWRRTYLG
jgi:hypothetical protein